MHPTSRVFTWAVSCVLLSLCALTAGQSTVLLPSSSAYGVSEHSVNLTCEAPPPNGTQPDNVAFFVNGTKVFDNTQLNATGECTLTPT